MRRPAGRVDGRNVLRKNCIFIVPEGSAGYGRIVTTSDTIDAMKTNINRRSFLSKSARAGAGLLILRNSKLAFAYEANSKLNIAGIGVGGQGRGSLDAFHGMGNNLVALCDVDAKRAGDIYQKHPGAKRYQDFREMFDQMEKQIDAVLVATPDHTHATKLSRRWETRVPQRAACAEPSNLCGEVSLARSVKPTSGLMAATAR